MVSFTSYLVLIIGVLFAVVSASEIVNVENRDVYQSINPSTSDLPTRRAPAFIRAREASAQRPRVEVEAKRAGPSPVPVAPTGIKATRIKVTNAANGQVLGYVRKNLNQFGEFELGPVSNAATVTFDLSSTSPQQGAITGYPFPKFGFIKGFSSPSADLASNSANYLYLGAVQSGNTATPPRTNGGNSFTAATGITEADESFVFSFNKGSLELIPRYVNAKNNQAEQHLAITQNIFVLTGGLAAFAKAYGPTTEVKFFVEVI